MPQCVIYTDHLVLSPYEESQFEALMQISAEGGAPERLDVLVSSSGMEPTLGLGLWAIQRHSNAPIVGFCGFNSASRPGEVEMLCGFSTAGWEEEVAKEACQAALSYIWTTTATTRIYAATRRRDRKSIAVMEWLGMYPAKAKPLPAIAWRWRDQGSPANTLMIYVAERRQALLR